jgi:hypothetical protein
VVPAKGEPVFRKIALVVAAVVYMAALFIVPLLIASWSWEGGPFKMLCGQVAVFLLVYSAGTCFGNRFPVRSADGLALSIAQIPAMVGLLALLFAYSTVKSEKQKADELEAFATVHFQTVDSAPKDGLLSESELDAALKKLAMTQLQRNGAIYCRDNIVYIGQFTGNTDGELLTLERVGDLIVPKITQVPRTVYQASRKDIFSYASIMREKFKNW